MMSRFQSLLSNSICAATPWFRGQGCPWNVVLCTFAADNGHLEMLRWLREHGCPVDIDWCEDKATQQGHNPVLEWLGQFTNETWHTITSG
jgi:hypothetical protein